MKKYYYIGAAILALLVLVLVISFFRTEELPPIKDNYSLEEILDKIESNYSKIKTIRMTFADKWVNMMDSSNAMYSEIKKAKLNDVLEENKLKIQSKRIEILKDPQLLLKGNFQTEEERYKYHQLINWLAIVYDNVLFLPGKIELKELIKNSKHQFQKMDQKGYYLLTIFSRNNDLYVNFIINMYYGIVEGIDIVQKLKFIGKHNRPFNIPYIINALFSDFRNYNGIYFPNTIKVRYQSTEGNYVFHTRIKKLQFNKKIDSEDIALEESSPIVWYNDPHWLDKDHMVMIKGAGKKIIDMIGRTLIEDKHFYLVKKNIQNNKDEIIKKLFSSTEKGNFTKFFFTADYNHKFNKLAYSLMPSPYNRNKELEEMKGLYILDLKNKKSVLVCPDGFLPKWSGNGKHLLYNRPQPGKPNRGRNDIFICDKDGQNDSLLIKNGFHFSWGKDDRSVIFEKGWWIMGHGYHRPDNIKSQDITGGIYLYQIDNKKETELNNSGFNPHVSKNRKKIIFCDRLKNSGIYMIDLEKEEKDKIIDLKNSDSIPDAFLSPDDNYVFFARGSERNPNRYGLFKYSIKENAYEFISNRIGMKGHYTYFLSWSQNNNDLLYKFYRYPYWSYSIWGVYNINKRKIERKNISVF
ncbi:MAG: hypothetical protein JW827_01165 [Spirochaetes bacterium]|nr:hypothetical protein [Spirochaetota bacterium]